MTRLAKKTQTALDELDWPYTVDEIEGRFMPKARIALDGLSSGLPDPCFTSLKRVVAALAKSIGGLPTGYGAPCVRHFNKRSEQLEGVLGKVSVESRFALIELAALACIAGQWAEPPKSRVTQASHKACLRDVARLAETAHIERDQWRAVIVFLLESPSSTAIVVRNVACALVWCGYLSPAKPVTDQELAQQFHGERVDRAAFVRDRQEALRWLPKLLEFSLRPPAKGSTP